MDIHFASAWEVIADAVPDAPALVSAEGVRTWRDYESRAARLAAALANAGLGAGSRVAIYLHNANEFLEAQFAALKLGGCPVGVSYRYKADALVALLADVGAEALVYPSCYAARIWEIQRRLPGVKCFLEVADGTENIPVKGRLDYETAVRTFPPMPRVHGRRADDAFLAFTAGATGTPKAVPWRIGDLCAAATVAAFAAAGRAPPANIEALPAAVAALHAAGARPVSLPAAPLAHLAGMGLGALVPLMAGGAVVALNHPALEPELVWEAVASHGVTDVAIAGDTFATPLLAALDAAVARGEPHDLGSLRRISSTGVPWSTASRQALLARHDLTLVDVLAAAGGVMGVSVATRAGWTPPSAGSFVPMPGVKVFAEDDTDVPAGSRLAGLIAIPATLPIGQQDHVAASAVTLRDIGGVRYVFPGDHARVAGDGALEWLGRGSERIPVAGGWTFAEDVEAVVKLHPDVQDCLVVGMPGEDDGGAQVVALVSMVATGNADPYADDDDDGEAPYDEASLLAFVHARMAGPGSARRILRVAQVRRSPGGTPDYAWARQEARSQLGRS